MSTATHGHHGQHVMPTSGGELNRVALSATLHCLTGCAIGEVLGMIIGTWASRTWAPSRWLSDWPSSSATP